MSSRPTVSILVVSYQTKDILRDCLRSIEREVALPHEVIVVDNASTDGSAEMVAREFPVMRLLANTTNVGFSPANNQAMAMAQGQLLLLLNPDTVVLPGSIGTWVKRHTAAGATISGPRLLNPNGDLQVSAWKVPGLTNSFLELLYLHRLAGVGCYASSRFATDLEPGFVSGAAMLFGREVFERIGGLDPEMFWMEDVDFCVRVRQDGGTCWYFHEPAIVHIGGQSAKRNMDRVISNQLISRIKFSRKHAGALATNALVLVIYLHVFSRIMAFGLYTLFHTDPRANAYVFTLGKLNRYLFKGDRSI